MEQSPTGTNGNSTIRVMALWAFSILSLFATITMVVHHYLEEKNKDQDRNLEAVEDRSKERMDEVNQRILRLERMLESGKDRP